MTDRNRAGDYGAPQGPYADVDVTRERAAVAGGNPLPFFGNNTPWVRPSLATFSTWLNQHPAGLSLATATDYANGFPLVLSTLHDDLTSNGCLTALLKPIGAPPWTITAAMAAFSTLATPSASGQIYFEPIILYDSQNDRVVSMIWWGGGCVVNVSPGQVRIAHYADTVLDSGSQSFVSDVGKGFPFPDYFAWFRVHNDRANLTFSIQSWIRNGSRRHCRGCNSSYS
jgi:hypothetical protein